MENQNRLSSCKAFFTRLNARDYCIDNRFWPGSGPGRSLATEPMKNMLAHLSSLSLHVRGIFLLCLVCLCVAGNLEKQCRNGFRSVGLWV